MIPSGHFYFNADIFSKGSVFASSKLQWSQELEHFSVCGESETAVVSRIQPLNNSLRFTFRLAVFLCGRSWLKVAKSEQSFLLITLIIFWKFFFDKNYVVATSQTVSSHGKRRLVPWASPCIPWFSGVRL